MSRPAHDSQCVRFLRISLDGEALVWYNAVVDPIYSMGQVCARDWTFSEAVYSHFVHDVTLNNAMHDFKHVMQWESTGISGLYFDLVKYMSWMLTPPTDSAMVDCIMNQIPSEMREWLIDKKNIVPELIQSKKLVKLCQQYKYKQKVLKHYQEQAGEEKRRLAGSSHTNHISSSCHHSGDSKHHQRDSRHHG